MATKTWKCPYCDVKMVVCDEAGMIALDRLARDKVDAELEPLRKRIDELERELRAASSRV